VKYCTLNKKIRVATMANDSKRLNTVPIGNPGLSIKEREYLLSSWE
jgi:hypothetical protein